MNLDRREFLATGLGLSLAAMNTVFAQASGGTSPKAKSGKGPAPTKRVRTTRMFKAPDMFPNALAVMTDAPGGLWIGQQKVTPANAQAFNLPMASDRDEAAW